MVCWILAKARLFQSNLIFSLIIATTLFRQVLEKMSKTSAIIIFFRKVEKESKYDWKNGDKIVKVAGLRELKDKTKF